MVLFQRETMSIMFQKQLPH